MSRKVLQVENLSVRFGRPGQDQAVVDDISFSIDASEVVALVGESGSGKSMTAMSVLGITPYGSRVSGTIVVGDIDTVAATEQQRRAIRGRVASMIFQDPVAALDPVYSIGFQLAEAVRRSSPDLDRSSVRAQCLDLLQAVEIPEPERRLRQYAHELSGGQCQRVMIAIALAADPALLIADEPTTALDVTVQAEVLDVLRKLRHDRTTSILLITHDMGVVADLADRVVVMRNGRVEEYGSAAKIFTAPQAAYTRELLAAVPRLGRRGRPDSAPIETESVLNIENLVVEFGHRVGRRFRAVNDVSFSVWRGEMVGLVGESGSGKTTIGKAIAGLAPITSGRVSVNGQSLAEISGADRRAARSKIGIVFQNPLLSLNPRYTVYRTIAEPLRLIAGVSAADVPVRVHQLLADVGLGDAWEHRYPHELSGGQRQRAAIARALALNPALLIADEPTSALDVSVQATVLDTFRELQSRLGFACLFISHDLAVVDELCDRVVVLHNGRVVELGDRHAILFNPQDPYTRRLIDAVPVPDPDEQARRREKIAAAPAN